MIIFFWFICTVLFLTLAFILIGFAFGSPHSRNNIQTLLEGFKEGLKGSGFGFHKNKYPVELYKWVVYDEEEVCDECLERASWPPMDIADWMAVGMPGTPEANTDCDEETCQCELVRYRPEIHSRRHDRSPKSDE